MKNALKKVRSLEGLLPICAGCQRVRLSADGKLFTRLFAAEGHDVKELLRHEPDDNVLRGMVSSLWAKRDDRYSEVRGEEEHAKAEPRGQSQGQADQ